MFRQLFHHGTCLSNYSQRRKKAASTASWTAWGRWGMTTRKNCDGHAPGTFHPIPQRYKTILRALVVRGDLNCYHSKWGERGKNVGIDHHTDRRRPTELSWWQGHVDCILWWSNDFLGRVTASTTIFLLSGTWKLPNHWG